MKLTESKFPILGCIKNNVLTDKIIELIANQVPDEKSQQSILDGIKYVENRNLQINYIAKSIHKKSLDTSNFIKAKDLLTGSPKVTGLLLLPETIYPDFTNVPDYVDFDDQDFPINAILYAWLNTDEFYEMDGDVIEEGEKWEEDSRTLFIIPIYNDGTTIGSTNSFEMFGDDELYGSENSEAEGRSWYGKIHDYVMSFILFYNYTDTDTKILNGLDSANQRRAKLNDAKYLNSSQNEIEL